MKTRIISGSVAIALFIAILYTKQFTDIPLIFAVCLLSCLANFEALFNTAINKFKPMIFVAAAYAFIAPLTFTSYIDHGLFAIVSIIFVCVMFCFGVFAHNKVSVQQCILTFGLSIAVSFAFGTLLSIFLTSGSYGILLILLLCGFAWITDTGAYFSGVLFGKHKIAPVISPKKTLEGCIGGIFLCAIYTFFVCFFFLKDMQDIIVLTLLSPLFSIAGMIGDLSASLLKRAYGIKDYSNIMPGHGGILDRFDSILFISPCFFCVLQFLQR